METTFLYGSTAFLYSWQLEISISKRGTRCFSKKIIDKYLKTFLSRLIEKKNVMVKFLITLYFIRKDPKKTGIHQ